MPDSKHKMSVQAGYVLVEDPPDYNVVWSEQPAKLQAISEICAEAGCRKVLIRGSTANVKLTTMETFELGKEVGKLGLRIAVVTSHDTSKANAGLLEDAATNRGSPVQFFDDERDALDWLDV